jgi:hypothetical protein
MAVAEQILVVEQVAQEFLAAVVVVIKLQLRQAMLLVALVVEDLLVVAEVLFTIEVPLQLELILEAQEVIVIPIQAVVVHLE